MTTPPAPPTPPDEVPVDSVPEHISHNIDSILAFYRREEQKISDSQRLLETVGGFMGRPSYLASVLSFVAIWLLANALSELFGFQALVLTWTRPDKQCPINLNRVPTMSLGSYLNSGSLYCNGGNFPYATR